MYLDKLQFILFVRAITKFTGCCFHWLKWHRTIGTMLKKCILESKIVVGYTEFLFKLVFTSLQDRLK